MTKSRLPRIATTSAHHVAGEEFGEDAQVDEGRRADFQPVRHAAAFALDIEAELAFRIFRAEIDFSDRAPDPSVTRMNW